MRLIDADAFKEVIDDVCSKGINRVYNKLGNDDPITAMYVVGILCSVKNKLKKEIDEEPTAAEQTWVSCGERLPEKDHIVTFESDPGKRYTTVANYTSNKK